MSEYTQPPKEYMDRYTRIILESWEIRWLFGDEAAEKFKQWKFDKLKTDFPEMK